MKAFRLNLVLAVLSLLAMAGAASAQSWTNRYDGPASTDDEATGLVLDVTGNAYVTGTAENTNGDFNIVTIKYASNGTPVWTNIYLGTGNGAFSTIYIAVNGTNIYITGGSYGTNGYGDIATVAYTTGGAGLWTNRYHGSGVDDNYPAGLAVSASGNVYVTGPSEAGSYGDYDYATVAYSSAGTPLWTNRYSGPGARYDFPLSIAADAAGNAYVTGASQGTNNLNQCATVAYSAAGAALWTNRYVGPAVFTDQGVSIVVDTSNQVSVLIQSGGGSSGFDYATVAYSALTGVPTWTNRYNGPANNNDVPVALALDLAGNVFVTGYSQNGNNWDYATLKYTAAGTPVWTNRLDAGSNDYTVALAVDRNGSVYVTGDVQTNTGNYDYLTVAYSASGTALFTNRYSGPSGRDDIPEAIAVSAGGDVYVTGHSFGVTNFDYLTVKYAFPLTILTNDGYYGFSAGHFSFDVTGPIGWPEVILASSNSINWLPIYTNTAGGNFYFSDPSTNNATRLYKARLQP